MIPLDIIDEETLQGVCTIKQKPFRKIGRVSALNRRLPNLPGRFQPSTFGVWGLNCRVRDGNGWNPPAIATGWMPFCEASEVSVPVGYAPSQLHREDHGVNKLCRRSKSRPRPIRIRQLHPLRDFHTGPINPVIYRGSYSLAR